MAKFNSNNWYQIYVNDHDKNSMQGTNLFKDNKTGSVYFNGTQLDEPKCRWQIYGINSTTHVLRTEWGGPDAFLVAKFAADEPTQGQTQAMMTRGDLTDNSVYWSMTPWGDGTFYMTNAQNLTRWRLEKKGNGGVILSSNITNTPPRGGQRWQFLPIKDDQNKPVQINDARYSTIDVSTLLFV
jgi:hypothetical protein